MIPTPIGAVVILLGLWLLFRPRVEMLIFVIFCSLFSGASALDAVVLGHSSIPPAMLALGFLGLRICRRDLRSSAALGEGLRLNIWLVFFCLYGAASAFVLPRLFSGRVYVIPMQRSTALVPLMPSSQNLTQASYLLGTGFAAVASSVVMYRLKAETLLAHAVLAAAWVHILTGLADALASAAHLPGIFDIVRNGAYAQLDQELTSFHRIAGLTPEASAFAALGMVFLVFATELWWRGVFVWRSGLTAIAMALILVASTSSTAYACLAVYGMLLILRCALYPAGLGVTKGAILLGIACIAGVSALTLLLTNARLAGDLQGILASLTVQKGDSLSGVERSMWARQGWGLMILSRGLGVGVGSFRSSSLFTAILGSMGPAALVVLLVYAIQVFKPWRRSNFRMSGHKNADIGAAAAWASLLSWLPAAFSAPSADPGILFAIFAGCSLVLRSRGAAEQDNLNLSLVERTWSSSSIRMHEVATSRE